MTTLEKKKNDKTELSPTLEDYKIMWEAYHQIRREFTQLKVNFDLLQTQFTKDHYTMQTHLADFRCHNEPMLIPKEGEDKREVSKGERDVF